MCGILKAATAAQPLISAESFLAREDFIALDILNVDVIAEQTRLSALPTPVAPAPASAGNDALAGGAAGGAECAESAIGDAPQIEAAPENPGKRRAAELFPDLVLEDFVMVKLGKVSDVTFSKMQAHAEAPMHIAPLGLPRVCHLRSQVRVSSFVEWKIRPASCDVRGTRAQLLICHAHTCELLCV